MSDSSTQHANGTPRDAVKQHLTEMFASSQDIKFETYHFGTREKSASVLFVFCLDLTDNRTAISHMVLPALENLYDKTSFSDADLLQWNAKLDLKRLSPTKDEEINDAIFDGGLLLYFIELGVLFSVNISSIPQRQPEESNIEVSVRGPKDGFVENMYTNVALIRKRMRTNLLSLEEFVIGRRTRTKVGLMYLGDVVNMKLVEEARERLNKVDIDGIFSSTQLEEIIQDSSFSLFPLCDLTGRPDFAVQCLMAGRMLIFVDGNPSALIAPTSLMQHLKSPEDSHFTFLSVSFGNLLRVLSLFISALLPGFYIAITTFHQDQIPFNLLATLTTTRLGTPFSAPLEMFVTLMLLEIFREAGVRLPSAIGQTLTVVGGLIIGDAAIRAGLISPSMVVVSALTAVAGSTLVNQALAATFTAIRFGIMLISAVLGIYGFLLASMMLLAYMASLRSFGVPYLTDLTPPDLQTIYTLFKIPWKKQQRRPTSLNTEDPTKQGEDV